MTKPTILITGASGGMGLKTCQQLAAMGWQVFAADISNTLIEKTAAIDNVTAITMDVSDSQSVAQAFAQVGSHTDKLDGIVNFAGILRVGSMSEMDEVLLSQLLNINVLGTYRVNKTFLALLLKSPAARIINISSETGWQSGGPFNGAYAMSKHAIEAYSDSLRRELMFCNIPVIKIQPGPFKTDMVSSIESNFDRAIAETQLLKTQAQSIKRLALKEQHKAHDPALITDTVIHALSCKNPKAAYSVKADPARSFLEYLPTKWADWLIKKVI
jgi:NAD(P)-dependent dehydrogenase (short-subunit alcohol dehydrogenase family)